MPLLTDEGAYKAIGLLAEAYSAKQEGRSHHTISASMFQAKHTGYVVKIMSTQS